MPRRRRRSLRALAAQIQDSVSPCVPISSEFGSFHDGYPHVIAVWHNRRSISAPTAGKSQNLLSNQFRYAWNQSVQPVVYRSTNVCVLGLHSGSEFNGRISRCRLPSVYDSDAVFRAMCSHVPGLLRSQVHVRTDTDLPGLRQSS